MNPVKLIKKTLLIIMLAYTPLLLATTTELPDSELTGSDGKKHHLKDYLTKGKWTTIVVWGPKCPACIGEMPAIQNLYDDRKKTNINVIGLAIDFPTFSYADIKQVQQFEEDYFITFPNLLISSDIYYELGLGTLQGTPTIVLVNPEGTVAAVQLGAIPASDIKNFVARQEAEISLLSKK